jgi:murein DD-endopeptidase MepM/ murein hydrolase activator NlpD
MKSVAIALVALLIVPATPAAAASAPTKDPSGDYAKAQARANDAAKKLGDAQANLAKTEDQVNSLTDQIHESEAHVQVLSNRVRQLAIDNFVGNRTNDSIFGITGDFNDDSRRQVVLDGLSQDSQEVMDKYLAARDKLNRSQKELNSQLDEQKSQMSALKADQANAAQQLSVLSKQLAAFKAAKASVNVKKGATSAPKRGGGVINVSGDWVCPVQGPHAFTDTFGAPRPGGRTHQGDDILAPRGTPVVANVNGVVRDHGNALGGLAYYLEGSDGNEYYGAHLEAYAASGQVSKGTIIGYVGNTGDAAGGATHLHFEIHPGGGPAVNPTSVLRQFC